MSGKLNKHSYQQLIDEDITWLKANAPDCLERQHIILTLECSVEQYYPTKIHCPDCGEMVYKDKLEMGLHHMTSCKDYEDGGDHK
jgi:hypothetical protein